MILKGWCRLNHVKDVIISGAAGNMGSVLSLELARQGFRPVLIDSNLKTLDILSKVIAKEGFEVISFRVDLTVRAEVLSLKERFETFGIKPSNFLLLASINRTLEEVSKQTNDGLLEDWNNDFQVGVMGNYNLCKLFLEDLKSSGAGSIVFMSSDLGIIGPDQTLYCNCGFRVTNPSACHCPNKPASYSAIKFAQIGLTKFMASTWGGYGIRTNALCPSGFEDELPEWFATKLATRNPMNKLARFEDISGLVGFLFSKDSWFINGAVIPFDGGRVNW